MLKQGLTLQMLNKTGHYPKEKNKKSYLKDNNDEDKKAKGTKRCVIKNLEFQEY